MERAERLSQKGAMTMFTRYDWIILSSLVHAVGGQLRQTENGNVLYVVPIKGSSDIFLVALRLGWTPVSYKAAYTGEMTTQRLSWGGV